jgi:hypothetical protein
MPVKVQQKYFNTVHEQRNSGIRTQEVLNRNRFISKLQCFGSALTLCGLSGSNFLSESSLPVPVLLLHHVPVLHFGSF